MLDADHPIRGSIFHADLQRMSGNGLCPDIWWRSIDKGGWRQLVRLGSFDGQPKRGPGHHRNRPGCDLKLWPLVVKAVIRVGQLLPHRRELG